MRLRQEAVEGRETRGGRKKERNKEKGALLVERTKASDNPVMKLNYMFINWRQDGNYDSKRLKRLKRLKQLKRLNDSKRLKTKRNQLRHYTLPSNYLLLIRSTSFRPLDTKKTLFSSPHFSPTSITTFSPHLPSQPGSKIR